MNTHSDLPTIRIAGGQIVVADKLVDTTLVRTVRVPDSIAYWTECRHGGVIVTDQLRHADDIVVLQSAWVNHATTHERPDFTSLRVDTQSARRTTKADVLKV